MQTEQNADLLTEQMSCAEQFSQTVEQDYRRFPHGFLNEEDFH